MNTERNSRSPPQWQKFLSRWVSNTKGKLANIKRCKRTTGRGNFSNANVSITGLEDRLLSVKGKSCFLGDGVTKEIGIPESDSDVDLEEAIPAAVVKKMSNVPLENQECLKVIRICHDEEMQQLKKISTNLTNFSSVTLQISQIIKKAIRDNDK
ncbi:uncharacterized protein LOC127285576 [Leptopilina boulardi]|uniref:uncharacterized protein LOC127285373 n=1 Tax=Leptopilina boulardi TaxID=63433 RepID=UPI0021F610DA|nr:uncharacterized protein LOC127285373 [Leptopilina boulardi]XP_051167630.1 uncharacterized protein LOC127285576 [Leptopilina boulardi]